MIYTIIIVLFFVVFLIRAFSARSSNTTLHEGEANSVNFWELVATLLATAIGGGFIFGLIKFGQLSGIIGLLLAIVYCFSFIALGMLAPVIRKACIEMKTNKLIGPKDNISLTLFIAKKYNKFTWGLITLSYGIIYIGFLSAQYVAIAHIIRGMGVNIPFNLLIILSASLIFMYIALAGFKAVLKSDIIQLVTTLFIFLVGVFLVFFDGSFSFNKLPPSYWDPFASPQIVSTFIWLAIFIFPSLLLRLDHWQRIITAKDDKTASAAYITSGIILTFIFITLLLIGAAGKIAGDTSPFFLYKKHILNQGGFLREIGYGLALSGFLCAVISSADTILNAGSSSIIQSLQAWGFIRTKSIYPIVLVSLIMTIFSIYLAIVEPNIVPLITEGFKIMTILLPAIISAIIYKKPNDVSATSSVLAGLISYVLIRVLCSEQGQWGYIIGFTVSVLVLLSVNKIINRIQYDEVTQK